MNDPILPVNDPRLPGEARLAALTDLEGKKTEKITKTGEINNHIHTIYSFSPYTPCMAALKARDAGLEAAGSVDHDSIAAAEEMLAACAVLGIGGCVGFEVRVSFKTGPDGKPGPFADRKINNPDSAGLVYMTVQGIPRPAIPRVRDFLKPLQAERLLRTRAMTASASELFQEAGLPSLDFEEDLWNRSKAAEGGGITERHLLAAMAEKLIQTDGKGPGLTEQLKTRFGLESSPKIAELLGERDNPHYLFDLIGVLKSALLKRIFIQPNEKECIPAERVTDFARSIGAIPAYAYLGDVGESPTGDKRAEQFEDAYIEELFDELARRGYQALTYMPPGIPGNSSSACSGSAGSGVLWRSPGWILTAPGSPLPVPRCCTPNSGILRIPPGLSSPMNGSLRCAPSWGSFPRPIPWRQNPWGNGWPITPPKGGLWISCGRRSRRPPSRPGCFRESKCS